MSIYSEEIWNLISKKLSGELTAAEKEEFQKWIDSDPRNEEFFWNLERSWKKDPEHASETFFFNYESGLNKLRRKIENDEPVHRFKSGLKKQKRFSAYPGWAMAAAILVIVSLSVAGSLYLHNTYQKGNVILRSYATSDVEQRIITLHDGSVVRLNRNSKIELGDDSASIREIRLEGEAFFDVVNDSDRPFIIHTKDAVIEVLGTSFNVKTGDVLMVAVQDGLVSLRNSGLDERSAAKLAAGQLGLLSESGQDVKIEIASIENYFSWMNGYLRYESMPFEQVIRQLERIYGEEHELEDPEMGSARLTVYTERLKKEEVLESISQALNMNYTMHEGVTLWQRD